MPFMFAMLGLISCLELWLWRLPSSVRTPAVWLTMISVAFCSLVLVILRPHIWWILLAYFSLYRLVNLLRLSKGRGQRVYIVWTGQRASAWLIGYQIILVGLSLVTHGYSVHVITWWYALVGAQLAFGFMLLTSSARHIRTTRAPVLDNKGRAERDVPSLTVAIPARNETADLEACLHSLIASDYPKLEILVLDDCSQEKRTPEIIQAFAHAGVRFVAGQPPPSRWLAKNYAYQQLLQASSGKLLLFCGVDARFETSSLRQLVSVLLQKEKTMLSVIPRNQKPTSRSVLSLIIQPGRYAWELALPRRLLNRPPVLSTCWLIERTLLEKVGGFEAVCRSISPESFFARQAIRRSDGYTFLCSDDHIGLRSDKSLSEQRETALRTRYPQLHRRLELVSIVALAEFTMLILPFAVTVIALLAGHLMLAGIGATTCLVLIVFYASMCSLTYRHFSWSSVWILPFAALYDIALLQVSLGRYEFGQVQWKGRNVCLPVMQLPSPDTQPHHNLSV